MKTLVPTLATLAFLAGLAPASAMPFYGPSGPQTSVPIAMVTARGWSECFSGPYGEFGPSIESVLGGCTGDLLMMAGGATNSGELDVLAWAPTSDVTFDTGDSNTPHDANGTGWYFNDNYSWGFAEQGGALYRNSCDYGDGDLFNTPDPLRLCWHTSGGFLAGGWRVGTVNFLNNSSEYTRYLFTADSSSAAEVPEPASIILTLTGMGYLVRRFRSRGKKA